MNYRTYLAQSHETCILKSCQSSVDKSKIYNMISSTDCVRCTFWEYEKTYNSPISEFTLNFSKLDKSYKPKRSYPYFLSTSKKEQILNSTLFLTYDYYLNTIFLREPIFMFFLFIWKLVLLILSYTNYINRLISSFWVIANNA